jgi:hypothetical protein
MLPIICITEAASFVTGLLSSGKLPSLDDYFANFRPLPGSTLGENQIGTYPFANQSVAANAIIGQPLAVSMLMVCPARDELGYAAALVTMMALQAALSQHDSLGGTYTIITPKFFYTDCIRLRMVDASTGETKQAQNAYQIDFVQPLLTLQQAQAAQNTLMSKLSNGTQINGQPSWSGAAPSVGNAQSLTGPGLIPATNTAPIIPVQSTPLPPLT